MIRNKLFFMKNIVFEESVVDIIASKNRITSKVSGNYGSFFFHPKLLIESFCIMESIFSFEPRGLRRNIREAPIPMTVCRAGRTIIIFGGGERAHCVFFYTSSIKELLEQVLITTKLLLVYR
jgi:hypothetical protein